MYVLHLAIELGGECHFRLDVFLSSKFCQSFNFWVSEGGWPWIIFVNLYFAAKKTKENGNKKLSQNSLFDAF